jgi:hypothetical protein
VPDSTFGTKSFTDWNLPTGAEKSTLGGRRGVIRKQFLVRSVFYGNRLRACMRNGLNPFCPYPASSVGLYSRTRTTAGLDYSANFEAP